VGYKTLRLEIESGIATVTLDQPERRNAMSVEMGEEFLSALGSLRDQKDVRILVLTGRDTAFCAGGDLGLIGSHASGSREDNQATMRDFYRRFLSVLDLPIPTLASINGYAIGAGLCFALACDLRIASETARMGMNFVRLGLHPGMGATYLLPRLVGVSRACELFFTGDLITGAEAARIGLVNRAVPAGQLSEETRRLAERIASNAPGPLRAVKRGTYQGITASLEQVFDYESAQQAVCFETEDFLEGIAAAREKRHPKFKGR